MASGERSGLFEVRTDDWDHVVDVYLKSAWLMTRHAERALGEWGVFVNISSVGAQRLGPGISTAWPRPAWRT